MQIGDENEMGGRSVEDGHSQDDRMNEKLSDKDIPVGEPLMEPCIGQEFESEAAAHAFYNAYATLVGFIMRIGKLYRSERDGSPIGRTLVCNKEGFRIPDRSEKILKPRAETRAGCKALIYVRKTTSGKWKVTRFVKEHIHPLTPGKGRKLLIVDQYPNEHDKIQELLQQLAIEKRRAATYKRHLKMLVDHIEEHNQSLSKKVQDIVESIREFEANGKRVVDSIQCSLPHL